MNQRMNEIKRQIMLTSWDIPLMKNERVKTLKLQKLDELKRELSQMKQAVEA